MNDFFFNIFHSLPRCIFFANAQWLVYMKYTSPYLYRRICVRFYSHIVLITILSCFDIIDTNFTDHILCRYLINNNDHTLPFGTYCFAWFAEDYHNIRWL